MTAYPENKAPLPLPSLRRWQPLRLGLVNLFHYDCEEFWFCDGHLLLRGNNGTGKSKVLSLTLPFLFDAQLRPSRIEPDGDPGKRMAWNLLLGKHDRRMGYTWIEFGRVDENGEHKYLTLGCGMYAVAGRAQLDAWFFLVDMQRVGQDLWLTSPQRVVLRKEQLKDALSGWGQVFSTHETYRRAIDERFFQLGSLRYTALMDTLIQLRQPQLSKKPDEANLSNALTEALPPLASDLLSDVADAMNQLEEDRRQLDEFERLAAVVGQFNTRYSVYAGIHSRRQAGLLRAAQTVFGNASKDLNAAKTELAFARDKEQAAIERCDQANLAWQRHRARHEELLGDPAMQDATRVENLRREFRSREEDVSKAERALTQGNDQLQREILTSTTRRNKLAKASERLAKVRAQQLTAAQGADVQSMTAANVLMVSSDEQLLALTEGALDAAHQELRGLGQSRREHIKLLQRRLAEAAQAQLHHDSQLERLDEVRGEVEVATMQREEADAEVENQGSQLVTRWQAHIDGLDVLQIADPEPVMDRLTAWVLDPDMQNPAASALLDAHHLALQRLATTGAELERARQALVAEQKDLESESKRLQAGEDTQPRMSPYRSSGARDDLRGAPFWKLVEFVDTVTPAERAGLEAALEASGILDAWVSPDGTLFDTTGARATQQPLHDSQLLQRPPVRASLATWILPSDTATPVAFEIVAALLSGVSCGSIDDSVSESWVSPDGRFRLGTVAGNWDKPTAEFIGFAARDAARKQRLENIALRLTELLIAEERNEGLREQNRQAAERASRELTNAPSDMPLRSAHANASAIAKVLAEARVRHERANKTYQEAAIRLQDTHQRLTQDATDLHLPADADEIAIIDTSVSTFIDGLSELFAAARELLDSIREYQSQLVREATARETVAEAHLELNERRQQAEGVKARLGVLLESVGAKVDELHQKLVEARDLMSAAENSLDQANKQRADAGEERARREAATESLDAIFLAATAKRQQAVDNLQQFAKTELIAIAVPDVELPDIQSSWTIEPALTLARRIEHTLVAVNDDDNSWHRIQKQISQDLTDLHTALGALHHRAQAETSDHGLVVSIIYQNRLMRPDQLTKHLSEEITQRRELLSAREREVLENHLQAEIAAAVQHLMRVAVRQVETINVELDKRPTSTGVKFRLQWQPLAEGTEGVPVGLEAARKRLLNTSSDLWTAEDRRVVGAMLQQRIATERERADTAGGGMLEQLTRALDYRRWHRFAVQRWQDGQWRKLSGPASSGERALGLTVPLFAAVASFYSHGTYSLAPRLVLLDEAFAGIDDDARAHCMGLIKEFDLDFVITSEREWACYSALPGVSICQLQRRPGIDAVHVSRWRWNGKSRLSEKDPDRRFPEVAI